MTRVILQGKRDAEMHRPTGKTPRGKHCVCWSTAAEARNTKAVSNHEKLGERKGEVFPQSLQAADSLVLDFWPPTL